MTPLRLSKTANLPRSMQPPSDLSWPISEIVSFLYPKCGDLLLACRESWPQRIEKSIRSGIFPPRFPRNRPAINVKVTVERCGPQEVIACCQEWHRPCQGQVLRVQGLQELIKS